MYRKAEVLGGAEAIAIALAVAGGLGLLGGGGALIVAYIIQALASY